MTAGAASTTLNTLTVKAYGVQAVYLPATNSGYTGSSSGVNTYSVTKLTPVTVATSTSPSSPMVGQTVGITATVAAVAGIIPTGDMVFKVAGVDVSGHIPLSNGSATINYSLLQGGPQAITVQYSGGPNYNFNFPGTGASNGDLNVVVSKAATLSVATSLPVTPVAFGTPVQLKGTITSSATGPTGFQIGVAANATFQDNGVDIPGCVGLTVTNGTTACNVSPNFAVGTHPITLKHLTLDPNFGASTSAVYSLTINSATTTTTLSSNQSSIEVGGSVTYTASVLGAPAAAGNPPGAVTFFDGGSTPIPGCTAVAITAANPAIATCTKTYDSSLPILASGSHQITAVYTHTALSSFTDSTSNPVTLTVTRPPSTVSTPTSTAGATYSYGTTTTFNTVVSPHPGAPAFTGTVQFFDSNTAIGAPVVPDAAGSATSAAILLTAGTHTITAQFGGDSNYGASPVSANLVVTVTKSTPNPVTLSAPAPTYITTYGGLLTTGVTNVPLVGSGVIPTGTVTLSSGGIPIAAGTLDGSGNYTFTNVQMPGSINFGAGQNLTVTYSGDANYTAATFVSANGLTVNAATSTAVVTSAPIGSVAYGQNVTFTATLTGPGSPATGTISFTADGNPINATCTTPAAIVTSNVAHCTVAATTANNLGAGSHTITVTNFAEANGNHVLGAVTALNPFVVGAPAPQIVITSSQNPSVYGQAVTFTATVSGPAGAPAPVGQLQFFDGSGTIGALQAIATSAANAVTYTLTVPSGSIATLTGGTHAISATYVALTPGNVADPNYINGASQTQTPPSVLQQVVNRAPSQTVNNAAALPVVASVNIVPGILGVRAGGDLHGRRDPGHR